VELNIEMETFEGIGCILAGHKYWLVPLRMLFDRLRESLKKLKRGASWKRGPVRFTTSKKVSLIV
jgi:hypothetical protein